MEISEKWIQQEKTMVQKRLERFRQAVNSIRQKNQALLKNLGFASFKELEKNAHGKGYSSGWGGDVQKGHGRKEKRTACFFVRDSCRKEKPFGIA